MRSDALKGVIVRAVQESLEPARASLAAIEELNPLKGKVEALETAVRQILEDKETLQAPGTTSAAAATPAPTASATDIVTPAVAPTRQQLPHPEPFDGRERSLFLPWKTAILAKLRIEGAVIGDSSAQFYYVHNYLKGRAMQIVTVFMEEIHRRNNLDPYHFIKLFDKHL